MKQRMTCSICGDGAGRFEQHCNRDTGFGICPRCVGWTQGRGTTPAEMLSLYGVAGMNYEVPTHAVHQTFTVLATFQDTDRGAREANTYMLSHPNAALLDTRDGLLILADKNDKGAKV